MPHLTPNTPAATAKVLRRLTSTLPIASPTPTPREIFTTTTAEISEALLTTLISLLAPSTSPETLNNALHTVFNISNTIPPSHLAPHWRTICQRVITVSKQSPQPCTLITLSSLLTSSIPLATLGTEQRAVVAAIAQQSLQHAQSMLSIYPSHSLCLIYSIIHAAPRELRSQALNNCLQALLKHPEKDVRALAAKALAAMVTCIPEKQQQMLFSERVEYINQQIIDATSLLNAFTGHKYKGVMSESTAREMCNHLDGIFRLLVELLDLPIYVPFPMGRVLETLCNGIRERVIDPYAVVEDVKITHDDLLLVIPHVQKLCARAIADVTQRVHKVALQMFVKDIGMFFEMRLSNLLLRSREGDGLTCVVERGEVYEMLGRLVTNLGTGLLDFVVPRFQELVEIDVALHKKGLAREKVLTINPVSNIQSGGKSRKRKRHNGWRDTSARGHNISKESVQGLASVYGNETVRIVQSTFNVALDVTARMFDCRGLLTKATIKHLQKLEDMLLEFLEEKRLSPVLLRAVTSAVLSGGSRRMTSEASPLLIQLTRQSVMATLDSKLSSDTRDMALAARAGCEAIIHPRGPPYAKESSIYPQLIGNNRLTVERHGSKDSVRFPQKLTSEQNGSLSNRGDREAILPNLSELVTERQQRVLSEDIGEKNEKTRTDSSPANHRMQAKGVAEIQPLVRNAKEQFSKDVKNTGSESIEFLSTKQLGTGEPPIDANNQVDGEVDHPMPIADKAKVKEHQTDSTAVPEGLRETSIEYTNASPNQPCANLVGMERAESITRDDTTQGEENKALIDHKPVCTEGPDNGDEPDSEKEDQAVIDSLVFEPSDAE